MWFKVTEKFRRKKNATNLRKWFESQSKIRRILQWKSGLKLILSGNVKQLFRYVSKSLRSLQSNNVFAFQIGAQNFLLCFEESETWVHH